MTLDSSDEYSNTSRSIRVNREFDSIKIDEYDVQLEEGEEPSI
jgi:hypothetical protein